ERGFDLRPLPATRREVQALQQMFTTAARIYLGEEASEERAKAVGTQASIAHFACHAFADESSPLEAALVLALPREWRPGRENGLLQAWEVFEQLRIDADLVTLSACGTAFGKQLSGEGSLSLTRAFQYAGARSVLASLWEVRDDSTAQLMERFYAALKRGVSKDEALRAAQLATLAQTPFAPPGSWAAFQLVGDWR